jgi:hypothetical protein
MLPVILITIIELIAKTNATSTHTFSSNEIWNIETNANNSNGTMATEIRTGMNVIICNLMKEYTATKADAIKIIQNVAHTYELIPPPE